MSVCECVVGGAEPRAAAGGKGKVGDQGKPQLVFNTFPGPFVCMLACRSPQTHNHGHAQTFLLLNLAIHITS